MLNRTTAPEFQTIQEVNFPAARTQTLDNGTPLYIINVGQQPIVRLEVIFDAGTWFEPKDSVSFFTMKMLAEGTKQKTAVQISEYFDSIGAFIDLGHGSDRANLSVYGLTKHLAAILPMVSELLSEAVFPEAELETIRNSTLQNLKVNQEKNGYLASVMLRQSLFGNAHPYGKSQQENTIAAVETQDLRHFYAQRINTRPRAVVLSGRISEQDVALVNQFLGQPNANWPTADQPTTAVFDGPQNTTQSRIDRPESVQTSIRLGKRLITRHHADWFKLLVTNEILGGYFGSRLMKNIREEKGLTYGISSSALSFSNDGYFIISSECKKELAGQVSEEIEKEIRKLQTELVPDDELQTVKNYMAGQFVGNLNTPFEIADRVKMIQLERLDPNYYADYVQKIRQVTPQQIIEIANKYWQIESLSRVEVG